MQEVFENIIEKLRIKANNSEKKEMETDYFEDEKEYKGERIAFRDAIDIVKQKAKEYEEKLILQSMDERNIEAQSLIDELKKIRDNSWIPCCERLPNKEECLLNRAEFWITDKDGYTYQATYNRIKQCWFSSYDNSYLDVIAWQPLPEPYQPKGE